MNLNSIRDWLRGYSQADIDSAVRKLEEHWTVPAGFIIPMDGREMLALVGENLMGIFWQVRDLDFVNHPDRRRTDAAPLRQQDEGK